MKKYLFIACLSTLSIFLSGQSLTRQRSIDIGLWGGGSYYLGDINTSFHFKGTHPAGGAFLRYNYNPRIAVRGSIMTGTLSGTDLSSRYLYQNIRFRAFSTPIVDFTGQFEFNFLPYIIGNDDYPFTPYVHSGMTFLIASYATRPYQVVIPMGVGMKFYFSKRIGAGIEYTFRKTFSDYIDRLAGVENTIHDKFSYNKQRAYFHDKDWYAFIGFFISYKLKLGGMKCPAYEG